MAANTRRDLTRLARAGTAGAVLVASGLVVVSPVEAATTWGTDDAVQVVAVNVTESTDPPGVHLPHGVTVSWPAPSGEYDGFELRRNGTVVGAVDATTSTALDPSPLAGPSTYSVVATLGGAVVAELPGATVAFPSFTPSGVITCSLLWTGAASQSWHDPRNWAPYGPTGGEGPVRAPTTSDTVCVDHQQAVPIEVTEPGATALAFVGTQVGSASLQMVSGELTITQPSVIPAIELLGGRLDLRADTRLVESNRATLLLGGGHLVLGGTLTGQTALGSNIVGGKVTAVPGTTSILDGGRLVTRTLDLDLDANVSIEGRNGHVTTVPGRTSMSGATTLVAGAGGAALQTFTLTATNGTNRVDWALAGGDGGAPVRVEVEEGETRLTDLVGFDPTGRVLSNFSAVVDGTLLLDQDIEQIDTVTLRSDGQLRVGGRSGNLEGLVEATSLRLERTPLITIPGYFRAAQIGLDGGSQLRITGALSSYMAGEMTSAELLDGRLTVGDGATTGWTTTQDASVRIVGTPDAPFVVAGDATLAGYVDAAYYEDPFDSQDDSPVYGATFTGDLTLPPSSRLSLSVTTDPADQPELTVEGTLTVEGALIVTVAPDPATLPDTFERRLVTATGPGIAFDPVEVVVVDADGEGLPEIRVEERADGIYAVRSESSDPGTGTCDLVWTGGESTSWNDASNWSPSRVPTASDRVCAPQPDRTPISISSTPAAVAASLTGPQVDLEVIDGSLTATGDVTLRSLDAPFGPRTMRAEAFTAGEIELGPGSSLTADSVTLAGVDAPLLSLLFADLSSVATVVVPASGTALLGGEVNIDGSVEVDGRLGVGLDVQQFGEVVEITGDLRLGDASTTEVLVLAGGEAAYIPQTVEVGDALTLDGDLSVEIELPLYEGFEWPLFLVDPDTGSVGGSFDSVTLIGETEGVTVEVVSTGVVLRRGAAAPGAWGEGAVPQVRGLTTSGDGDPLSVTVTWPDPAAPFALFELRRNGEWAASGGPEIRQLTDSPAALGDAFAGPAVYTVVGINSDGSESSIATAPVVFPGDPTCSITWVGTVGDHWDDERNWAPTGVATLGGQVRVPAASDHVCIPQDAQLLVADTPAVADRITGVAADLDVAGVALSTGDMAVRSVVVVDGRVDADILTTERVDLRSGSGLDVDSIAWSGDESFGILTMTDTTLTSAAPIVMPADSVVTVDETVTVNGSLSAGGLIGLGTDSDRTWLYVSGDLTLGPDALTEVRAYFSESEASPGSPPFIAVEGRLTIGGDLTVDVVAALPDPFLWPLFAVEAPVIGAFETIALTGQTGGARVDVRTDGVYLTRGELPPGEWGEGALPQVASLTIDAGGAPASVTVTWPVPAEPFAGYELRRGDVVVATTGRFSSSAVDPSPVPGPVVYTVVGIDGAGTESPIETAPVIFPGDPSCSIVWVGTAGTRWGDQRNWAPTGQEGLGGPVRIPTASDHVCIPQDARLLIADTPAVADRVTGAEGVLSVSGISLTTGDVAVRGIEIAGSTVRTGALVAESIEVGSQGRLFATAVSLVGAGSRLALSDGEIGAQAPIVVADGQVSLDGESELSGSLVLTGTTTLSVGGSGDTVLISIVGDLSLSSEGGTLFSVDPDRAPTVYVEGDLTLGGTLIVDLTAELPDPFEWPLIVGESQVLGAFAGIALTGASAGARVEVFDDGVGLLRSSPRWAEGDGLQVTGVTVDGEGDLVSVGLSWPAMSGTPSVLEVVRTALGVDTVIGTAASGVTSFVDTDPLPDAVYAVRARVEGVEVGSLGDRRVVFPADPTCSILWTDSTSSPANQWLDQRNWAPFGVAGGQGAVRVPSASDHACRSFAGFALVNGDAVAGRVSMPVSGLWVQTGSLRVGGAVDAWLLYANEGAVSAASVTAASLLVLSTGSITSPDVSLVFDAEVGAFNEVTFGVGVVVGDVLTAEGTGVSVSVFGAVDGNLVLGGDLTIESQSVLDVYGDLEWSAGSVTRMRVDPARPSSIVIDGVGRFDGALEVEVLSVLPEGFEHRLLRAGELSGAFSEITLTDRSEGARIETRDDGIYLVQQTAAWAEGDAIQVDAVTVDGDGDLVSVGLSWPAMSASPESFDVVRVALGADTVIGTVAGEVTSFVDVDPLPDATYRVDAVGGGAKLASLGDPRVAFPAVLGCSILWTGSASDLWLDERNWAPFGVAGAQGPVRVPGASDHVCIPTDRDFVMVEGAAVADRVSGSAARVQVASGALTVTGAVEVWILRVDDGSTLEAGSVTAPFVGVFFASLTSPSVRVIDEPVLGDADFFNSLWLEDAVVTGDVVVDLGASLWAQLGNVIEGDLSVAGGLDLRSNPGLVELVVTGDVTLAPTAVTRVELDPSRPALLTIDGAAGLGGALVVDVESALPAGFEHRMISTPTPTGVFATVTLTGQSAGARIETRADGIYLLGEADGCAEVPDAAGLEVGGCWRDEGDDTFTHDHTLVEQPGDEPSLGGIELAPSTGTELTLDLRDPGTPVLSADGPVELTIDVDPRGGSREAWTFTEPALDWSLGGAANPLPTDTFLGLPAQPALVNDGGALRLRAAGALPAPFDGAPFSVDVPVTGGIITSPVGVAPATSLGGVLVPTDLGLSYLGGSRWDVRDVGPGIRLEAELTFGPDGRIGAGTFDLRESDLTGLGGIDAVFSFDGAGRAWTADLGTGRSARFTEGTGGRLGAGSFLDLGPIDLGLFVVDGPIRIARDAGGLWQLPNTPGAADVVQGIELGFDRGRLEIGELRFGDLDPLVDVVPTLGDVAGWLPLGGFEAGYDQARDVWFVNAYLDEPDVRVGGEVGFEDGALATGALEIEAAELGGLAQLDLRLAVIGPGAFAIDATLLGAAFDGARSGSGSLSFDDGALTRGRLELERFPIGDLFVIDDLRFDYDTSTATTWGLSGSVAAPTDGAAPAQVDGNIAFTDGVLTAARLELRDVGIGPSTVDLLSFELDRTAASGARGSSYLVAGQVRGPRPVEDGDGGEPAPLEPIRGSATILDGRLTGFSATIPSLEIPGIAYLRDLELSYQQDGSTAVLAAAGAVRTATSGSAFSAGSFQATLDDGRVERLQITASQLDLAGLLTVESFQASYLRSAPLGSCPGLRGDDAATVYALSGTVRGSQLGGCIALAGRSLVGALLTVDQLAVADLVNIRSFRAEYADSTGEVVSQVDAEGRDAGQVTLRRTTLDLAGTVEAGATTIQVDGLLEVTDGGVSLLELAIDRVPLAATFALTDVDISYQAGPRFSPTATRSFAISGNAVHDQGTTSAAGALDHEADGRVRTATLEITELPLGPVVLEQFAVAYDRRTNETEWLASALVTAPDDPSVIVDVTGRARFTSGRLTFAELDVPAFSVGELVMVTDLRLAFERFANGSERWSGTGGVAGFGQLADPASATVRLDIGADGRFTTGLLSVSNVRWGGLFHLTGLTLSGSRNAATGLGVWVASGQLSIGGGRTSALSGNLTLQDGRAVAGSLSVSNLGLAGLATLEELTLAAATANGNTVWTVGGAARVGDGRPVNVSGEFEWRRGRLDRALVTIGNLPIGELFRIEGFALEFVAGDRWSAAGSIVDEDGTSTLGGEVVFTDGVVSGGLLEVANLQLGPLDLVTGKLRFDTTGTPGAAACGFADGPGDGTRIAVEATARAGDGTTSSLGGRLRLDRGRVTEGVLCASGVKFADFLVLDGLVVRLAEEVAGGVTTTTFSGAATTTGSGGSPTSVSVDFALRARQLQALDVQVGGLVLGDLLTLRSASITYDRATTGTSYAVAAAVAQPGGDAVLAGSLGITDGIITAGSLGLSQLRFGDSFTLTDLQLSYFGRALATTPTATVVAGGTTTCAATPTDSNVPVGFPRAGGPWSQFSVAATVVANGDTYAASGSLLFGDGDLRGFDVSLACLPIGDLATLEGVRIAMRPGSALGGKIFQFAGRLRDDQGTSAARGFFSFQSGRLAGGEIELNRVPIGAFQIHQLRAAVGENLNGDTQYALSVVLQQGDTPPVGGGGSLTMRDGRVIAGSIRIDGLRMLDLFTLDRFDLAIDGSTPGTVRLATALQVSGNSTPGSGEVAASLTFVDGRVTAGSFVIGAAKLFDAIPIGRVSGQFDGVERRWGFEINIQVGSTGPALVVAADFQRGRVVAGALGFDIDGDGIPDGTPGATPPAGGSADMDWFPVKALFVSFCGAGSTASYCLGNGVSSWSGRIGLELPTDAAPALDMQLRVVDGAFDYASATLTFPSPGIPLYPALFLRSISGSMSRNPWVFAGGVGLGVGPGLVNIDGALAIGEGPPRPANINPGDYEPEYLFFASTGSATIPIPGVTTRIQASNVFQSNGFVGLGVQGEIGLGRVVSIAGGVEGAVFNASGAGMNLTNPQTGARLTGWHAQARGFVEASIFDVRVAGAEGVINTIGAHAQADLLLFGCLGGGMYWSDGSTTPTCDQSRYAIAGVGVADNPNLPAFRSSWSQPAGRSFPPRSAQRSEFVVEPGEAVLGVEVLGAGSELDELAPAPDASLVAPSGRRYGLADHRPDDGVIVHDSANKRWFFVADPEAGIWRMETTPTSVPIVEVFLSRRLPDVDVTATITPVGGDVLIDYELTEIPGQEVLFSERAPDGGEPFEAAIGTAAGGAGRIRFTPSGAASGGTREVVATVLQNGFTRREIVIGTYTAPDATLAGPPRSLAVSEIAAGAAVSWQPPASNGGRRITSYRITSDIGWSVSVPADLDGNLRGELPIPAMQPGDTINVYVQARTGLGWGEAAAGSFTATQTTGLQYEQGEVPSTNRPDLGGGLHDPPDAVDPSPTNPPDPTAPTPTAPTGPSDSSDPIPTPTPVTPPTPLVPNPASQAAPPARDLPRTGTSTAPIGAVLAAALLFLGVALRVGSRRDGRRT
jgi:hypothetical protein